MTVRHLVAAAAAAFFLCMPVAYAQHQPHSHGSGAAQEQKCPVGEYGCGHMVFHEIYRLLELISSRTCCNDSEGRPC